MSEQHTEFSSESTSPKGEGPYVSSGVRLAAAWSWRGLVIVAAAFVALYLLSKVDIIVMPVLIALLLSALLTPMAAFLGRHGWPRGLAAATVFVGMIVVVLGLLTLVGQQIYAGFSSLWDQVKEGVEAISTWLGSNPWGLDSGRLSEYVNMGLEKVTSVLESQSGEIASGALGAASSVGTFMTGLVLTLFTTFFFVYDGHKIFPWLVGLLPARARDRVDKAGVTGWWSLVQYVRVQILVAAVDSVGIGIGAICLQIPLVIPLMVLVFLGSFIPIVGAVVTGFVAVVVALVSKGIVSAVIMLIVVLAVQQIEGHVLQPFVMGKAVSVHPLAVVLAVSAGGFMFGILGALFAVPLVACGNTVVQSLAGRDPIAENQAKAAAAKEEKRRKKEAKRAAHG
ncbi:AI-2E family transporter [Brevibacterium sp. 50QC2O2]|uniref:AI-2E family transporter n=1 Tax=Brevibacterium TaxID=1696 RepID=UPI00211C9710|nr:MULTISPECIES: AI-2E family transporter [unclassified Brevibacterium]MCQ9385911.1 AI-2E family transporter [Brevibacterium sp. 68QC2CO]MCQ9387423.1 AI-2E family transporter [Brevibacterium sp. 50QC2O2]